MRITSNNKNFTKYFFFSILLIVILIILNLEKIKKDIKNYSLKNFEILLIQNDRFVQDNVMHGESKFNYLNRILKNFPNFFKKTKSFSILKIDLEFKYLLRMREEIENANKINYLHSPKLYPVNITYDGKSYKGKIRLKGILPSDHYRGNIRWSFKIDLKKDQYIDGLNEFIIQKPIARQFPYDHLFHEWIRPKNILTSTHGYKKVIFNGEKWGIMNFESSYTPQFIEQNRKKFAPIVSYGNTDHWYLKKVNSKDFINFIENSKIGRSEIEIHNKRKIYQDIKQLSLSKQITNILKSNLIDEKNIHHYFDVDKFGYLISASIIWQTFHALSFENLKFYINPYTLKIEPVVTDQSVINFYGSSKKMKLFSKKEPNRFITYIIHSDYFKKNFEKYLKELENNLEFIYDEEKEICSYFVLDCPKINKNILLSNFEKVKKSSHAELFQNFEIYKKNYFEEDVIDINKFNIDNIKPITILVNNNKIIIENLINTKIKISKIKLSGKILDNDLFLDPFGKFELKINNKFKVTNDDEIEIIYSIGKNIVVQKSKNLVSYNSNIFNFLKNNNYKKYFYQVGDTLKLKRKINIINDKIIIPENFKIVINPGQKLLFGNDTFLISFSPIFALGLKDNKIEISGLEKNKNFKGIYLLNSNEESLFKNVIFQNLNQLTHKNLNLTGCINFYNTKIKFINSKITNSNCEDLINFIYSTYEVNNSEFLNSISDGIDADFSDGIINNSFFKNIGGDAIDLSGSNLYSENIFLENIRDKAFSIGEKSRAEINNVFITGSGVGLAAKDGSEVKIFNSQINMSKLYDIMAYEKKNFYGPSEIYANKNKINLNKVISANNNLVIVDEEIILTKFLDVKKMYLEDIMKK